MRKIAILCVLMLAALAGNVSAQTTVGGTATLGVSAVLPITVALAPTAVTVATNSTQPFLLTLMNDMASAGANLTLSCTGSCGTLSLTFARSGTSITYTAPSTANTITLTATSAQDSGRFITVPITVTSTTPPAVVNFASTPAAQASASTNTYPIPPTIGNSIIAVMGVATADTVSGVQACNGASCVNLTQACPAVGACFGTTSPGGSSYQYYGVNLPPGLTSVVVANSVPSGNIDVGILDVSGLGGLDTASIASNQTTATTTPSGPALTPSNPGELLVSNISSSGNVLSVAAPFIFAALDGGDGMAYTVGTSAVSTVPSYTSTSGTWSGFHGAYALGTTPSVVRVNIAPTTANVQVHATQQFTATVTNDTANAGVNIALSGGSCSGATCGTLSSSSAASGKSFTYTAPSTVPGASVSRIQHTSNVVGGPSGSLSITASSATDILCGIAVWNTTSGTLTVSDSASETYTAVTSGTGTGVSGAMACKANNSGGVTSLSFNVSGSSPTEMEYYGLEYAGVAISSPVDQFISATGSSSPMDSGFASATTNANDVLIGFGFNGASLTFTAGDDGRGDAYTILDQRSTIGSAVEDFFTTSATNTYKATLVPASASGSRMFFVALKASAAGSSNVTLTATSVTDGTKTATAAINVGSAAVLGVSVSSTASSTTAGGGTVAITPTVSNDPPNGGVTFSLSGVGTLSASSGPSGTPVTYTPPSSVSSTQTVTITATAVDDGTKSAVATITVSQTGTSTSCSGPCPAFPTAQGAGAAALGGRGGVAIEVTNLNDSGTGSLRACTNSSGPRTCVFRVSGTIALTSRLQITNPFLTIAGQTAPGSGIVIGGPGQSGEQIQVSTHDVVIRYITWSGNAGCVVSTVGGTTYCDFSKTTGPAAGTVGLEVANCGPGTCHDIIFDHTTMRWAGNKGWLDINNGNPSTNVTFQWGLGMEPNAAHPVITEPDSTCGGCTVINHGPVDFHHNFVANYDHRWILYNLGQGIMQNNIAYNGLQLSSAFNVGVWGGMFLDMIGNKFIDGPQSSTSQWTVIYQKDPIGADPADCQGGSGCDNTRAAKFYFVSNISHSGNNTGGALIPLTSTPADSGQQSLCQVVSKVEGGTGPSGNCASVMTTTPSQTRAFPITPENVANLDNVLLATVGNSQHLDCNGNFVNNRDSEATRVVQEYINHTGGVPFAGLTSDPEGTSYAIRYNGLLDTSKKDAVWTTGTPAEPPPTAGTACTETLHDGIPDAWKTLHGLSTSDTGLAARIDLITKYTFLEDYLNGLIP